MNSGGQNHERWVLPPIHRGDEDPGASCAGAAVTMSMRVVQEGGSDYHPRVRGSGIRSQLWGRGKGVLFRRWEGTCWADLVEGGQAGGRRVCDEVAQGQAGQSHWGWLEKGGQFFPLTWGKWP